MQVLNLSDDDRAVFENGDSPLVRSRIQEDKPTYRVTVSYRRAGGRGEARESTEIALSSIDKFVQRVFNTGFFLGDLVSRRVYYPGSAIVSIEITGPNEELSPA